MFVADVKMFGEVEGDVLAGFVDCGVFEAEAEAGYRGCQNFLAEEGGLL